MPSTGASIVIYLYTSAVFYQYYIGHIDFSSDQISSNDAFDYIVVGGGTAGSLVAARLSEDPSVAVLLIDRGGSGNDYTDIPFYSNGIVSPPTGYTGTSLFKSYKTTPQKYVCLKDGGKCNIVQGNSLGGGSNANSNYVRGSPLDYNQWERMGAKGWSYQDVLPFFKKSEKCINATLVADGYHGTDGEQYVTNKIVFPRIASVLQSAAEEEGFIVNSDYNDARFTNSFDFTQYYGGTGQVYTSRRAFLEPALKRSNLKVISFSLVTKILFHGKKATGVKYHSNGKDFVVKVSKEVIVSAGAVGSPQLLMLSGIGDSQQLNPLGIPVVMNLPAVGKGLQDQIYLQFKFVSDKIGYDIKYSNVKRYFDDHSGNLAENPTPYIGFLNIKPYSINGNDTRMEFLAIIQPPGFSPGLFLSINNLNPASKGFVKLKSADPFDDAIINPNYLVEEEDRIIFRSGVKILVKYAKSNALKKLNLTFKTSKRACSKNGNVTLDSFLDDDFIDCYLKNTQPSLFHLSSTCRMGDGSDTKNTVVDPQLRIIGIENVRVIDSSIMPHLVRGNPNGAVTMIGEKGAFMIRQGS